MSDRPYPGLQHTTATRVLARCMHALWRAPGPALRASQTCRKTPAFDVA